MKQLVLAYKNFTVVMDCMCNKYGESEGLRKIRDEAMEIFVSFYDDATQKSQREAQHFNTDLMKDAVVDLHSAHMGFKNLQLI
mgnify:CR=1 FL=1